MIVLAFLAALVVGVLCFATLLYALCWIAYALVLGMVALFKALLGIRIEVER